MLRHVGLAGLLIGAVIAAAGAAIFANSRGQTKWDRVDGRVLESTIARTSTRAVGEFRATQYWTLSVRYSYDVAGRSYTCDRYSSTPPRSRAEDGAPPSAELRELVAEYAPGTQIDVYVSPENPERALLQPRRSPVWLPLAIGVAVAAVSAALLLGT